MCSMKREMLSSSSDNEADPDFVTSSVYKKKKKRKAVAKKGKFSLTKLRKKYISKGFGSQFERKEEGGASGCRGYHHQGSMTTSQPPFGGDTVPSSHGQQNGGVIEVSLDSPTPTPGPGPGPGPGSGSGEATARVVAQVLVSNADRDNGQPHFIALSGPGSRSYTSLTPVNPAGVPDGDGSGGSTVAQQGVQFVHYVEGASDHPIYQTNGQMTYPVYAVGGGGGGEVGGGSMYSSGPAYYATPGAGGGGGAVAYASAGGGAYLLQHPDNDVDNRDSPTAAASQAEGAGYLVAGDGGANDGDAHGNLSHANRVSPATLCSELETVGYERHLKMECPLSSDGLVKAASPMSGLNGIYRNPSYLGMVQWLLENYETAEGVSLPRSTLYNHYLRHCARHKLEPVNAASFGKLIRSVFLGLRTRRLGTRGNSKYHYYGIRIKPGSSLNVAMGDDDCAGRGSKRYKMAAGGQKEEPFEPGSNGSNHSGSQSPQGHDEFDDSVQVLTNSFGQRQAQGVPSHLQYLGDSSHAVPDFPAIVLPADFSLPAECSLEDVDTLRSMYREHCEAFLDAVVNMELATVDSLWREFWRAQDNNNGDECEEEKYLSKTKLYELCKCEPVQDFVRRVDFLFYQNLVQVLIPDVLRPIPSTLTQSIRNFAKGLECWLTAAMAGVPVEMTRLKVSAVGALAQTLRRYTSLNHLAQAARAVLQNAGQIGQMLLDLNRVDFHNVQEQASWVCQCDDEVVQRLENDFKLTLQRQNSLEQWAGWLKGVVTQVLKPYEGKPSYAKAARQFLLKWSFYSSMVIRDLTLRSAASFGSFHLIRLLYDEYMFYLVEHQVARETGETPIAVMGEKAATAANQDSLESLFGAGACNGVSSLKLDTGHPSKRPKIS